jgi:AcrR family transcriptional regulator
MSTTRVRMSPDSRREQLIALGVQLLATRSLEDLSIETLAEEAGISRGLLYHYFGNKQAFHTAVVQRASDDLFRVTAPSGEGSALEQLAGSLARYVDYVAENYHGYVSLVRGAAGGHEGLRQIYDESRAALTGRLFDGPLAEEAAALGLTDTPAVRLLVRGWAAFTEEVVLDWVRDNRGISRDELLLMLAASLPGILAPMRPQDDSKEAKDY